MAKTPKIEIEDHFDEFKKDFESRIIKGLLEAAGEVQKQAARNSRVDTTQLKESWDYTVDEDKFEAHVGSPLQNAIWEEYGTGEYAVNGDGRKTPWRYKDRKGKWHTTTGKKPNKTLQRAIETKRSTVKKIIERNLKN